MSLFVLDTDVLTLYYRGDAAAATFEKLADMPGMGERRESTYSRLAGWRVWRFLAPASADRFVRDFGTPK